MYVAVKGGAAAIDAAHQLLAEARRGDPAVPELSCAQIDQQLSLAVDRVMAEGALYDRGLAALAIKQARGDLIEAIFLLRAYRTTLPRLAVSEPVDTGAMRIERRISATFKDLPGGQVLGPTFDYTHRLLDMGLADDAAPQDAAAASPPSPRRAVGEQTADGTDAMPRVTDILSAEALLETEVDDGAPVADLTRDPPTYPAPRDARLQALARGDEGFLLALGYATQRGYGHTHPFAAEIRMGWTAVEIVPEELGFPIEIGDIQLTECQMVNQFKGADGRPPQFTRGYGLTFGHGERKAMGMALVDRALRSDELGQPNDAPTHDQEFVLSHCDNVEASGFTQHLKLPHYVDFQAELNLLRALRADYDAAQAPARTAMPEPEAAPEPVK
ncbi:MAG TPA: carbon-phosphorus lyase complex subunit PhnI [Candidatus Sulfotelmatobacter sp.]|nr:carbon-phosphorus lyase complex subunit PhnI [Candidatus Sulfotelmatobacter sp.]